MPARTLPPSWARRVPNALSACRLALALLFPAAPDPWRFWLIVAAGLSDFLDGHLARRWHARTAVGGLLDAMADKLFTLSVLLTLLVDGAIAWWQIALILARDLVVGLVALHAALRRERHLFDRMVPRLAGKATTAFVLVWLLAVVAWPGTVWTRGLFGLSAACSLVAAADYLVQYLGALRADRAARRRGPDRDGPPDSRPSA